MNIVEQSESDGCDLNHKRILLVIIKQKTERTSGGWKLNYSQPSILICFCSIVERFKQQIARELDTSDETRSDGEGGAK